MNEKTNFKPRVIGLPDARKEKAIINAYSEICQIANATFFLFECFNEGEKNLPMFFEFLKAKDTKAYLYRRFIEMKNISYPGLSIDKIIELDLLAANMGDIQDLLKHRADLLAAIEKVHETSFYFPLSKLFHQIDDEISDFGISFENPDLFKTPEFDAALFKHVRKYTFNEQENKVLDVVERAVNALNDLMELDIIRNEKQKWNNDLNVLVNAIEFTLDSTRPLSIDQNFPKYIKFKKWFEDRRFMTTKTGIVSDILSNDETVLNKYNEMPEISHVQGESDNEQSEADTEDMIFLNDQVTHNKEETVEEINRE